MRDVLRVPDLRPRGAPGELLRLRARLLARHTRHAVYRIVEYAPGKIAAAPVHGRRERELLPRQHEILDFRGPSAGSERALQLLKVLVEGELVVLAPAVAPELPAPFAGGDARDDPVEDLAPLPDGSRERKSIRDV